MAAISVTATSVLKGTGCTTQEGIAGASITAGQAVYMDSTDSDKIKLADADASTAAAAAVGISLHAATSGQPIEYAVAGNVTFNAVLTAGKVYVVGGTAAGDINPVADLTTNWRTTVLGVATSTTNLRMLLYASGVSNA